MNENALKRKKLKYPFTHRSYPHKHVGNFPLQPRGSPLSNSAPNESSSLRFYRLSRLFLPNLQALSLFLLYKAIISQSKRELLSSEFEKSKCICCRWTDSLVSFPVSWWTTSVLAAAIRRLSDRPSKDRSQLVLLRRIVPSHHRRRLLCGDSEAI